MAREREGVVGKALDALEERTGYTLERGDRLRRLEEAETDRRILRKELDLIAYTALDYVGGQPQDLTVEARRKLVQRSRVVWMKDPQAGASVDLMNDFTFGRGVPKPKAKDPVVQEAIDEAWDDPANQRILTSHQAQLALGTDMSLQSNLFVMMFDDGDDGRVRLSLLDHDAVLNVVKHPEDRFTHLWYVAQIRRQEWDFEHDAPKPADMRDATDAGRPKVRYFEHWRNVSELEEDENEAAFPRPPARKLGEGRVYHVAENRTSEMTFGHPRMERTLRWHSAYNGFMEARVDMMRAAAAFIMKRKVKGTPNQLAKMATKALSYRSDIGATWDDIDEPPRMAGPRGASIINENEQVEHENFKLDTSAGNAAQDAQGLRAQISAATRWPQSYYGDADSSNLATATSLELPVLKAVETRQELFEGIFRWFVDRVIERAVETGAIPEELEGEEAEEVRQRELVAAIVRAHGRAALRLREGERPEDYAGRVLALVEAHEDKAEDEAITKRDLSYEFQMPNPLRRAMGDLIGAVMNIARTFDPNNTNVELSRALLLIAMSEGLEVQDASDLVDRIFPEGYVDPAVAQAQAGQQPPGGAIAPDDFGPFGPQGGNGSGPVGPDGQRHPNPANPYGAPQRSSPPEAMQQARFGRDGLPLEEAAWGDMPPRVRARGDRRGLDIDRDFEEAVVPAVEAALAGLGTNGNGRG